MDQALPDALVTDFENLIDTLPLPDLDDRHVLAAAITARADTIVTWNVKDFPSRNLKAHHLVRQAPDAFILEVITAHEALAIEAIRGMRSRLRRPPVSPTDLLDHLARQRLGRVVAHLRQAHLVSRL
jgi:PIN domain